MPSFLALRMSSSHCARSAGSSMYGFEILLRERLSRERRRCGREGLCRPRLFTRHVGLRHRPFLNRPQRLARYTIEHVEKPCLARLRDNVDRPARIAGMTYCQELGACRVVVVPDVVVHHLEMPQTFAGARVEREQTVAEEVCAGAIGAIEVVLGTAGRDIDDAACFVDRELRPRVGAADCLPCICWPRVVTELAGPRHGVKRPHESA